jgi:hypothetical protein
MRFEKLQNCMLALQAIKNEGIYLLGIGPEGERAPSTSSLFVCFLLKPTASITNHTTHHQTSSTPT